MTYTLTSARPRQEDAATHVLRSQRRAEEAGPRCLLDLFPVCVSLKSPFHSRTKQPFQGWESCSGRLSLKTRPSPQTNDFSAVFSAGSSFGRSVAPELAGQLAAALFGSKDPPSKHLSHELGEQW